MMMTDGAATISSVAGGERDRSVSSPEPIPADVVDQLMAKVRAEGLELLGEGGVLAELTKTILERALDEELTDHVGYERGDPAGRGSGNSRNGTSPKRVLTEIGAIDVDVPRDRNGSFEPVIVPKGSTRLARFNANVVALYARGLSTRDIRRELKRMYGVEVSPDLVSRVTDGVVEELREWQHRPLDAVYPIVYIDALVIKVRTQGVVTNRPAYLAIGVDVDGRKHVFGVWLGDGGEGAKFWLSVLTEIRHRGVADVIFVCCDGLKGLPDAIEATWPAATVQTCVIHLIRASLRFASWKDRKRLMPALRAIYTAVTVEAAAEALDLFELEHGDRYPGIVTLWRHAWEQFIPFLAYPAVIRKIVYTTDESVNPRSWPAIVVVATRRRGGCRRPRHARALRVRGCARLSVSRRRRCRVARAGWGVRRVAPARGASWR